MLAATVEWKNREASTDCTDDVGGLPPIITYTCHGFSYEEFGTVFRILTRQRVSDTEILTHKAAIDFFGPFKAEHILVELAVDGEETAGANQDDPGQARRDDTVSSRTRGSKKARVANDGDGKLATAGGGGGQNLYDTAYDTEVIVCESEERQQVVMQVAKEFNLPYVPFRIVFVEGTYGMTGDAAPEDGIGSVPMMPVAIALG